ncbi:MAG: urea transporter [Bacteroidota bacterium]
MKNYLNIYGKGFINSYSQLFFADSKVFAWLLLLSSFVNPITGLSGMVATAVALAFSYWIGLDRNHISYGMYSYNALMIGLVLGAQYNFTPSYFIVLSFGSVMSVLMAVWFNSLFHKYKLPALSLSFLVTLWLITIGLRSFNNVEMNESGLFRLNEWYNLGGSHMVEWMNNIENTGLPEFVEVYLKSLSAVFFQYNIISGLIILVGLIIWSRIAFLLSILGFVIGYLFYFSLSGEFSQLYYSYIGFNFILTAIALGGFYLIPSRSSFILAIIAMPIIGICISGFSGLLSIYQLPLYSLPFSVTVILLIMLLNQRVHFHRLILVPYQYFSPEKNLYHYTNNVTRFQNSRLFTIRLPFYGEWFVSQGYDGTVTHKEEWKHALDFVVVDETSHTFKLPGEEVTDFYCYNLPALAPADGYVVEVLDGIDDNAIGESDIQHNWGNTIVIKHADGLFSKLSHLKKETISVHINDYVKAGQMIAACGSSGRSPEPHLHFQLQATQYIGSETIPYPLGYFVSRSNETYIFHEYDTPQETAHIHHPIKTPLLADAFHFIPGKKFKWEVIKASGATEIVQWECAVNAWNQSYLYCAKTKSYAYFVNNGTLFYFTEFYGSKKSLLFDFYLAAQKILLGYYQDMCLNDSIAAPKFHAQWALWLQDSIAPFYQFMKVNYQSTFITLDNTYAPNHIVINSNVKALLGEYTLKQKDYELTFTDGKLSHWNVSQNNQLLLNITCLDSLQD